MPKRNSEVCLTFFTCVQFYFIYCIIHSPWPKASSFCIIFLFCVTWLHFCHHFCSCSLSHSVMFVSVKFCFMQFYLTLSSLVNFLLLLSATLSCFMLPLSIFLLLSSAFCAAVLLPSASPVLFFLCCFCSLLFLFSSLIFFFSPGLFFSNLLL